MLRRIVELLRKEFLELKRDRAARFRLLVPPIVQMVLFGYAATFEIFRIPTVVLDQDHTLESRALVSAFVDNGRFHVEKSPADRGGGAQEIESSDAQLAIIIPAGFAALLRKGRTSPIQVLVDGTNSNTALIALGYVGQIAASFGQTIAMDLAYRTGRPGTPAPAGIGMAERYWYNPNLNSRWFFVPGVIGTLTLITIVNLTAFAIVREREVGTLEQIMVTPIRPFEFMIGKSLPFFLIGLAQVAIVTVIGMLWFRVPFNGNPFVLTLGTCLFLLSVLAIGLLISTICRTQQQAFASNFFILNPMFILSGFSFPIPGMPAWLQWLTYLNPLRYYLVIVRGTFIKGVGLSILWPSMLGLLMLAGSLLLIAVLRFHKSID